MRFTTSQRIIIPCVLAGLAFAACILLLAQDWLPVPLAMVALALSAPASFFAFRKQFIVEEDAFIYKFLWMQYRYPFTELTLAASPLTALPLYRIDLRGATMQLEARRKAPEHTYREALPVQTLVSAFGLDRLQTIPIALAPEDTQEFLDTLQEAVQDARAGTVQGQWWPE